MGDDVVEAMSELLEVGEQAHLTGDFSRLANAYVAFNERFGQYAGRFDEWVHYVRYFVDCWIDASNHDWQFHEPIEKTDWVWIATEIKNAVGEKRTFSPIVLRGRTLNNDY